MQSVLIALVSLLALLAAANLLLTLALARRLAEAERLAARGPEPRMPRIGTEVAEFSVPTADGGQLTDAQLRSGRTLLVFSMSDCGPCAALAEELQHAELPTWLGLLVLVGASEGNRALAAAKYPVQAQVGFLPPDGTLTDRFEVDAFPTVVLVEEGSIMAVGRNPGEVLATLAVAPA
ncbi:MAG TPA: hypothetical protein VFI65_02090 [Streptosporangiaceae bacterium]|nr:hypothetical protein [Streptosporangiaceae bacterium]